MLGYTPIGYSLQRDGISAIKIEAMLVHFLSGIFVAVAVVVA